MAKNLLVSFLGGVGEIGKNMTVLEYENDMIIVDCGASFADSDKFGVDAVVPDITYVQKNIKKLRGIVLTHGHEDHIGAIPYFVEQLNCPIYGTALTLGLLNRKLEYDGLKADLREVKPRDVITLGAFRVEFIKVAHSMAGACALAIYNPVGTVFVTGDFKFDTTPIDNKKTDIQRIAEIGGKGVLLMLGESTNVERKGSSKSEKIVGEGLEKIFVDNVDRRIIIATFASSNYRVQQILWLAEKYGRKVLPCGRSMKNIIDVAEACGEIKIPKGIVVDDLGRLKPDEVVVLATGSQGEHLSALEMMSRVEYNKINIGPSDIVVLSSSPIPGNEKSIYNVINNIYKKGAEVVYDAMNEVHVSGHAYEEELKFMLSLVRPTFFMPVHGEYRHQYKHAYLANDQGIPKANINIPEIGQCYTVSKRKVALHSVIPHGVNYVDGILLDDGTSVVNDRQSLSQYGMLVVMVSIEMDGKIGEIRMVSRGMNFTLDVENQIQRTVYNALYDVEDKTEFDEMARVTKKALRRLFMKDKQYPIIIPIIVRD